MNFYRPLVQSEMKTAVHKALRAWRKTSGDSDHMLAHSLIVRQQRRRQDVEHKPTQWRLATNKVLLKLLEQLEEEDEEQAQVLRYRFLDKDAVLRVRNKMNVAEATIMRIQRSGLAALGNLLYIWEIEERNKRVAEMEAHMHPPTYSQLFGVDELKIKLFDWLTTNDEMWVLAITGIGGIGKTALADFVTRKVIQSFRYDDVAWLRLDLLGFDASSGFNPSERLFHHLIDYLADYFYKEFRHPQFEQRLVQVQVRLNARPHLIVIDNLESKADTAYLLNKLQELAQPSRFLITTRTPPESEAGVYSASLDQLSFEDASALMCQHAHEIGVTAVTQATPADFSAIYEAVGGNSLALKLAIGLLSILPLGELLAGLKHGQGGKIEKMYRHIYQTTWGILSSEARKLLLIMPLIAETGGDSAYLQAVSGLDAAIFWPAVQELRHRSLLDVRGGLHEKQFGIHRLTEVFVRMEIAQWGNRENDDGSTA